MNTLEKICADKRDHIARKKAQTSLNDLRAQIDAQEPPRGFIHGLSKRKPAIIAEVK